MQRMRSQAGMREGPGCREGHDIRCVAAEVQMKRPSRSHGHVCYVGTVLLNRIGTVCVVNLEERGKTA